MTQMTQFNISDFAQLNFLQNNHKYSQFVATSLVVIHFKD